jgi:hypothetical protein
VGKTRESASLSTKTIQKTLTANHNIDKDFGSDVAVELMPPPCTSVLLFF